MRKYLLFGILVTFIASVFGQKFMVKDNDTFPYEITKIILKDTIYHSTKILYPGDTEYVGSCNTFEKINDKIVNVTHDCLKQGFWIEKDTLGEFWKGNYVDNHEEGTWEVFDSIGRILEECEFVYFNGHEEIVKEVDYINGKPVLKIDRAFYLFYTKWAYWLFGIILLSFFGRYFMNSKIYNLENGTNYSVFGNRFIIDDNSYHAANCFFTFWFFNYKPENKRWVTISNFLSATMIVIILGILIGLAVSGELNSHN